MNSYYEKILATGEVKCIDEEIPFDVPQGWEWCRVSSLFQINPKVVAEDNTSAAFIPMEAISAGYGSEFRYYEKNWGEIKSGYTAFADNDIAFAKITPCFQNRKSVIFEGLPNGIGAGTTELKILRTYGETINRWFVLYFLESPYFIDEATFKGTANQQRIIVGYLENKLFPLPPLPEQERIVGKIGLVMPIIDKYSKSQELLDKMNVELNECLKKSVLQEAIQGKLVPQIDEEGTAQELLEQIKAEKQKLIKEGKLKKSALDSSVIFRGDDNKYYEKIGKKCVDITDEIPFEIPASWAWCHLNDIAESDLGKTMNKGQNSGELVPYLCSINVYWNKIDLSKIKQAQFTEIELAKYLLQKNDLLICEGGDIGRAAIWDINETMYYQNALHRVRFYGKIFPKFFLYILSLYKALGLLDKKSKGMTIKHFTKTALNSIVIPLPPLLEQKRIIETIEQLMQLLK